MVRATVCFVAFVLTAPLASVAVAQAPPRDTANVARGTAGIRGRVVDGVTGRGLTHAEVWIGGPALAGNPRTPVTDGDGRYEITDLPAGSYTVTARKPNYLSFTWGQERPQSPGKPIVLVEGQKADVNFRLGRAAAISGKVVDEFGEAVTDVAVVAMQYRFIQGSRRLAPAGRGGSTNDIGEFRVYGLEPGQYYVSATLRNFTVSSDNNGVADREGYAPTYYPGTPTVGGAQRVAVAAGQTLANVNFTLLTARTAKLTGSVVDSEGKPAAGMVVLMQRNGAVMMNNIASPLSMDGKFTLGGVTPGEYTIQVRGGPAQESATIDVNVAGGDINDLQLVMAKPSTIRGRIAFADSATAAAPPRASAIDMGAWRDWALGQQVRAPAKINDDGTFEISLGSGRVFLRAAPIGGGGPNGPPPWRLNRVIANDADVADTGIEVPVNGTVDNVVVEMTNHVAEISGHVVDAEGKSFRDCFVVVFAQDPAHWTIQTRHLVVARPGPDELFRGRLLAGAYYAVAMTGVEPGAWTDPDFLRLAAELATKFSVGDGEKKTVDLAVVPAPVY